MQGVQGEGLAHLEQVLPSALLLDMRMGSQAAILAMCDAFPGQLSIRRTALDHFRRVRLTPVPPVSPFLKTLISR